MMYQSRVLFGLLLAGSVVFAGCSGEPEAPAGEIPAAGQLPEGHPPLDAAGIQAAPSGGPEGVVLETMDAAGYTYALVEVDGAEMWAAGPVTPLTVGETVVLAGAMGMRDFRSNTLNRTFDEILFVTSFSVPAGGGGTFAGNSGIVRETMNASSYTYVLVEIEGETMWLAGPTTQVEVGQTVGWMGGDFMQNFASTALNRTFDAILFVTSLQVIE